MARNIETLSVRGLNIHSYDEKSNSAPVETWMLVALHEVLVELHKLNSLLHCHNFITVPAKLDAIVKNTKKPKKKKKKKAPSKPGAKVHQGGNHTPSQNIIPLSGVKR